MNFVEDLKNLAEHLESSAKQYFGGSTFKCTNDLQKLYNLENDLVMGSRNLSQSQQLELQNAIKSNKCKEIVQATHDLGL